VVEGKKNKMSHVFLSSQHLSFLLNLRPSAWWGRAVRVSSLLMCLAYPERCGVLAGGVG